MSFHIFILYTIIDFGDNIIRKGAISAYEGELLIPINMRDGSILAIGKGILTGTILHLMEQAG